MGVTLGPYNPQNPERMFPVRVTNVSLNTSSIVSVTCDMRQVRRAIANYSQAGSGAEMSGSAVVKVYQVSGAVVDVMFMTAAGGGTSTGVNASGFAGAGSGTQYSGGILTVWAYGD